MQSLNLCFTWPQCRRRIDRFRNHNKHLADSKEGSSDYRASGIGARQMNVLLSYDETRVGRTTRFAKILTMPGPLHEFIILRIQPISRRKYQEAPFAMRVTAIGGERRA